MSLRDAVALQDPPSAADSGHMSVSPLTEPVHARRIASADRGTLIYVRLTAAHGQWYATELKHGVVGVGPTPDAAKRSLVSLLRAAVRTGTLVHGSQNLGLAILVRGLAVLSRLTGSRLIRVEAIEAAGLSLPRA